ncbi:esterase-like activity of phytase family protein [Croceitalea marina]|uniref:Esterase-like activity of phytase family protein n=1 Tax=Croceitalea marina TaxID=1775166 RepID=A0ABW5MXX3_9FLAO
MKISKFLLVIFLCFELISCGNSDSKITDTNSEEQTQQEENDANENEAKGLVFVDEYSIPADLSFEETRVGGLSGIDYANGQWYLISDDPNTSRFYTADIVYNSSGFTDFQFSSVVIFKDTSGVIFNDGFNDPEAIRIDGETIVWTSEGNINNNQPPSVNFSNGEGDLINTATLASRYNDFSENNGPLQNGAFEGLSLSADNQGYWVSMELPLQQDGPAPTPASTNSHVRVAFIDKTTGVMGEEFAYKLDPVARAATLGTSFELNGVVEILAVSSTKFLFLERSFATGYADGGYNIKIYEVDTSNATDISSIEALDGADFISATKTLLFDFEDIRPELTNGLLYNLEGMTFGPNFENGNRSLLIIADNNFNAIVPQLNQCILLEWID